MSTNIQLNEDCFLHIFQFLGPRDWLTLSKVCKRWKYLFDRYFLKKVHTFEVYNLKIQDRPVPIKYTNSDELIRNDNLIIESPKIKFVEVIDVLKEFGPKLKTICLFTWNYESEEYLFVFGKHCYKSQGEFKFEQMLQTLSNYCTNIESVKTFDIRPEEEFLWTKLIENNSKLHSFLVEDIIFNRYVTNIMKALPDNLRDIDLRFTSRDSEFHEMLDRQTNLKNIFFPFDNRIWTDRTLLKHEEKIQTLKLYSYRHSRNDAEYLDISRFVDLEKIVLTGHLMNVYSYENIMDNLKKCPKLTHVKLAYFPVTQDKLTTILSLPNLQVLHLNKIITLNLYEMAPSIEMKQLSTLKINLSSKSDLFCSSLCVAIYKMPVLNHLCVRESHSHVFCKNYLFRIIETIAFRGECVQIVPLKYVYNYNYCRKKIVIHLKIKESSKKTCFKLEIEPECLDEFNDVCNRDSNKLLNYVVLKQGF